jgi:ABC-type nitrate/sulfonate/bicarbonate transport system substrate-binding protein
MKQIRLALDWTPNINHIGFYVAKYLGIYEQHGIQLEILNPMDDNYSLTPGKKLETNLVDFAIAPFETVISLNNKKNKVDAMAVFAILQEDLSCIVTLANSKINHPKNLDHKSYASYKARYEDHIVRQLVVNDGGFGTMNIVYPEKLGIWNTILEEKADATWIFDNWEGVEATQKGIELNRFFLKDFGIPYGYSPVVLTKQQFINSNEELCIRFLNATRKGYLFTQKNPTEAISLFRQHLTADDLANIDLSRSLEMTSPYFGNEDTCGIMTVERINAFLNWLVDHKLENEVILHQQLFTNDLLI